jgi:hypothetical protein
VENSPNVPSGRRSEKDKEREATASQIALAWLLTQGEDAVPIPGITKLPVRLMLRSDQPKIFVETANMLWTSRGLA